MLFFFQSNWLNVHILEVDKKYSTYLSNRGIK